MIDNNTTMANVTNEAVNQEVVAAPAKPNFKDVAIDVGKVSLISAGTTAGMYGLWKLGNWIYKKVKGKDHKEADPESKTAEKTEKVEHVSGTVE